MVALINDGGHGGTSAAPAALQVYQSYFHHTQRLLHVVGHDQSR